MATVCDFVMHLPQDYYPCLGEFMFRCSQLESQMHEVLWRAVNIGNREGRILTIGTANKALRGMLQSVTSDQMRGHCLSKATARERKLIQEINSLVSKSREFTELRNRMAHGSWQSPIKGRYEDVQLLFMREQNEKYLARFDRSINDSFLQKKCRDLKALNIKAQLLILDISEFRGIAASNFHSKKYLR